MRLTASLLFGACLQAAAGGNTQTVTLSLKNTPMEQVFKAIERQTGDSFVYFKEDIDKVGNVNLEINNASLEKALGLCFTDKPLSYVIVGKYIILKGASLVTITPSFSLGKNTTAILLLIMAVVTCCLLEKKIRCLLEKLIKKPKPQNTNVAIIVVPIFIVLPKRNVTKKRRKKTATKWSKKAA